MEEGEEKKKQGMENSCAEGGFPGARPAFWLCLLGAIKG
jgi:hypothetical protein